MKIDKMKKEDLELLSYKEITSLILEEKGAMNTLELFNKIAELLELPKSSIEKKIGDYYTTLTTDKNFLLLEDGKWDLRKRHTSDKVAKADDNEEEEEEEEVEIKDEITEEDDDYDSQISDDDDFDDGDDDLKDLVVLDEEELELEQ
ncbi:MAG: DNA-directed RNA polymerase subunit delta [Bacilli bacterium]|nr:DNA-directed RNA polymerase subunit delta [Bacilli bacterium]